MSKTHYRKVFKSDHLGVADLEDLLESGHNPNLIFTINEVKQEFNVMVAGNKGNFNIAYFKEKDAQGKPIKPWVLNATNSKSVKKFAHGSSFVEDWAGISVQLVIVDGIKMMGEIVGGIRIAPRQPKIDKRTITPNTANGWKKAIASYKQHGNFDNVLAKADISIVNQNEIIELVKAEREAEQSNG